MYGAVRQPHPFYLFYTLKCKPALIKCLSLYLKAYFINSRSLLFEVNIPTNINCYAIYSSKKQYILTAFF